MGRMAAFGALMLKGFGGWTGVPKAGEEDGIADEGITGRPCLRKIGAGVLSMILAAVIDSWFMFGLEW